MVERISALEDALTAAGVDIPEAPAAAPKKSGASKKGGKKKSGRK
jgi:hypothetical protein